MLHHQTIQPGAPTSRKRALRGLIARPSPVVALLGLLVAITGGLYVSQTSAQQPTLDSTNHPAGPQERPRRVGTLPPPSTTSATPSPSSPATKPASSGSQEVDEDEVVRVETRLVSVPANVTDRTGRPMTNLRAENFALFEDGQLQRITNFSTTDAPFEVALLLDTSGSARAEVNLIQGAAHAFVAALRPGDRVAILAFNTHLEGTKKLATVEVKAPLTNDRTSLREAIESIGASNGTPFYDGLDRVAREVFHEPPREEVRGRRALVALTDGVDSTSNTDFAEVRARLKQTGVVCYFVQVNTEDYVEERLMQHCEDSGTLHLSRVQLQRYRRLFAARADAADYMSFCRLGPFERMTISRTLYNLGREEMSELARDSGGKTFPIVDLQEARAAFRQVANEIGTQYSLGYYPTNKARDGRLRAIRVEVKGVKGAQVRARESYQAPRS